MSARRTLFLATALFAGTAAVALAQGAGGGGQGGETAGGTSGAEMTSGRAPSPSAAPGTAGGQAEISTISRRHHAATRRRAAAPTGIYAARPMWRGADPTWGPGTPQMREYQRQGRCVIDEGYGRFTFCDTY